MRTAAATANRGEERPGTGRRPLRPWALAFLVLSLAMTGLGPWGAASQEPAGAVYIVEISGEIDLGLAPYLQRVLDEAAEAGAAAVILEIDTPGGRLDAVLEMRDALFGSQVPTVAFVNRTAFSAGALIALASERIYMAPGAVMGAATPVDGATGETATAKVVSAVRSTFRATAEERGRDPLVAEAMVDPDVAIPGLVETGQLLTLSTAQALGVGYAEGEAADRGALLVAIGLVDRPVVETAPGLAERVVRFVTNPIVASLLIALAVLLIVGDAFVGGFGIAAGAGVGLLALFFWGHTLAGLAGWEDVALVALGLALIGLEIFVVPGFGVPGVLGLAALLGGLFLATLGREFSAPGQIERAGLTVAVAFVAIVVGVLAWLSFLPRSRRMGGLVLSAQLSGTGDAGTPRAARPKGWLKLFGGGEGLMLPRDAEGRPGLGGVAAPGQSLSGSSGVAVSDLHPAGVAEIAGVRVDVVTDGEYIGAGEAVEVVRDERYRRVVRRLER